MTQCRNHEPLTASPASAGLFDDVGDLASGSIRLRLQGHYRCLDVDQPFYRFAIIDSATKLEIGEITFMPSSDLAAVATVGHSGLSLSEGARGKGNGGAAVRALAPLARRHGLSQLTLVVPKSNDRALAAVQKLGPATVSSDDQHTRYVVPV
jgi:RimJ/RimL family protein N-acetyltransferase